MASTFWRNLKVLLVIALILALASMNVLTLVNDQAHAAGFNFLRAVIGSVLTEAAASRMLSRSPTEKHATLERSHRALESKHTELKRVSAARSQTVKDISTKVARRAIANAGKNIAAYAAEVVPFVGVAAITAITISDLYDDCQTLKDVNELSVAFEHEAADENTICGFKFP